MSEQTPPSRPRPAGIRYPLRTRLIVALVAVLGVGGFVLAGTSTETDTEPEFTVSGSSGEQVPSGNGVEALVPGDGDEVLGQQRFGVDLEPGWTGELLFLPSAGNPVQLPDDELDEVSELNQIFYQPLPGKTIERLPGDRNCVVATIWSQVRGREASEREISWCFFVV